MIQIIDCSVFDTNADIIAHQVNCKGVMGSGVAGQVKHKYPEVYRKYKDICDKYAHYRIGLLGKTQICPASFNPDGTPKIYVANMFGQLDYGRNKHYLYTIYISLRSCLMSLSKFASENGLTIAMPYKLGCDRGNGDWEGQVYPMIQNVLQENEVLICRIK